MGFHGFSAYDPSCKPLGVDPPRIFLGPWAALIRRLCWGLFGRYYTRLLIRQVEIETSNYHCEWVLEGFYLSTKSSLIRFICIISGIQRTRLMPIMAPHGWHSPKKPCFPARLLWHPWRKVQRLTANPQNVCRCLWPAEDTREILKIDCIDVNTFIYPSAWPDRSNMKQRLGFGDPLDFCSGRLMWCTSK